MRTLYRKNLYPNCVSYSQIGNILFRDTIATRSPPTPIPPTNRPKRSASDSKPVEPISPCFLILYSYILFFDLSAIMNIRSLPTRSDSSGSITLSPPPKPGSIRTSGNSFSFPKLSTLLSSAHTETSKPQLTINETAPQQSIDTKPFTQSTPSLPTTDAPRSSIPHISRLQKGIPKTKMIKINSSLKRVVNHLD